MLFYVNNPPHSPSILKSFILLTIYFKITSSFNLQTRFPFSRQLLLVEYHHDHQIIQSHQIKCVLPNKLLDPELFLRYIGQARNIVQNSNQFSFFWFQTFIFRKTECLSILSQQTILGIFILSIYFATVSTIS